ncbi:MAG TPA: tetratricopeptide repeat protein [Phycisphaerae bacterium]|nr:tetratricopeptide repeat protein [Phycisphaerae bacterium]
MTRCVPFMLVGCWLGATATVGWSRQSSPSDEGDAVALARQFVEEGNYEQVIETLKGLPEDKAGFEAHRLLGAAYLRLGRLPEARQALRTAVRLRAVDGETHCLLGDVYLAEQKFGLAAGSYAEAQRLGSDTPQLHYQAARAAYELGNYIGKMETRTIAGGVAGRVQDGCYLIEPVPEERDRFFVAPSDSAIYHVQRALDGGLDTPRIYLLHADIWLAAGRHVPALDIYRRIEETVPEEERARYNYHYALACRGADDLEGYLDRMKRAIALDEPRYGKHLITAYRRVADYYSAEGDLKNYIRYLELAAKEAPASADLHYLLGNALFEAGRTADASRQWRLTLELEPDHADRERMLELVRMITSEP